MAKEKITLIILLQKQWFPYKIKLCSVKNGSLWDMIAIPVSNSKVFLSITPMTLAVKKLEAIVFRSSDNRRGIVLFDFRNRMKY